MYYIHIYRVLYTIHGIVDDEYECGIGYHMQKFKVETTIHRNIYPLRLENINAQNENKNKKQKITEEFLHND